MQSQILDFVSELSNLATSGSGSPTAALAVGAVIGGLVVLVLSILSRLGQKKRLIATVQQCLVLEEELLAANRQIDQLREQKENRLASQLLSKGKAAIPIAVNSRLGNQITQMVKSNLGPVFTKITQPIQGLFGRIKAASGY
jgi:hypothetical protein